MIVTQLDFFFPPFFSFSHGAAGGRSVSVASNRGQLRISDSTHGRLPERVWAKSYLSFVAIPLADMERSEPEGSRVMTAG